MSRRPAPTRGGAGRPPAPSVLLDLPGLWVDLGEYSTRRAVWIREPAALWRCRVGCIRHAAGPVDVAQLVTDHAHRPHQLHDPARHAPRTT